MATGGWNAGGPSPFMTTRARERAPQVLAYAAVPGAAMLISPAGEVVLLSGDACGIDVARVARAATAIGAARGPTSFRSGSTCIHSAPICQGWTLCVLSNAGVHPAFVFERMRRASRVLALALSDGSGPSSGGFGSGGAPAELFVAPARLLKD